MVSVSDAPDNAVHLGGKVAGALFAAALLSYVVESQLAQYVQSSLGYRQPFFIFWAVHSSFALIFPLHFLYIVATTKRTAPELWASLIQAITAHLSSKKLPPSRAPFPTRKFLILVAFMTMGSNTPALLWFAAVSLAPLSDVNAIWNANAFFAYLLTVKVFNLPWERRKLGAVTLATVGVLAVVYGDVTIERKDTSTTSVAQEGSKGPSAPVLGDLLTLVASVAVASYQVLYKKYAAQSTDPEHDATLPAPMPNEGYQSLSDPFDLEGTQHQRGSSELEGVPRPLPFGLFPNFLTSGIGFITFFVLWPMIPLLDCLGLEKFRAPPDAWTALTIAGIALTGVVFNAGFMILLGVWGPIVVSVGNLLTIVLVLASDYIFGNAAESITFWSLAGSGAIVAAFVLLASDMSRHP